MQQSRLESLAESMLNIVLGLGVALVAQLLIFRGIGIQVPFSTNVGISAGFTVLSVVRSYAVRRWFNAQLRQRGQRQQTRVESLVETLLNVAISMVVTLFGQAVIFPWFGIHLPLATHLGVATCFTAIGVARGYIIRRWFNAGMHRVAATLARSLARCGAV